MNSETNFQALLDNISRQIEENSPKSLDGIVLSGFAYNVLLEACKEKN